MPGIKQWSDKTRKKYDVEDIAATLAPSTVSYTNLMWIACIFILFQWPCVHLPHTHEFWCRARQLYLMKLVWKIEEMNQTRFTFVVGIFTSIYSLGLAKIFIGQPIAKIDCPNLGSHIYSVCFARFSSSIHVILVFIFDMHIKFIACFVVIEFPFRLNKLTYSESIEMRPKTW